MTRSDSFSAAEWALLGDAPLASGAAVALASSGGGRREANAMVMGWREVGSRFARNELLSDLIAQLDPEQRSGGGAGDAYANIIDEAVGLCSQAVALLQSRATPDELEAYCGFVIALAEHVAEAQHEGSFLGIGGDPISAEERLVLDAIARALGYRR